MTQENPMSEAAKAMLKIGKAVKDLDGQILGISDGLGERAWVTVRFPVGLSDKRLSGPVEF